jgi:2-methylisocitrate lyase-like PEP mutase family enzyme
MTGAGVCASAQGLPDIGLLTLTEMAERASVLADLLDIPLIADADTGYGSPINVVRTVRQYERAGVAAIQLEDQVFPKRCGHLAGKDVIDAERFMLALQAAIEARRDPDTVIIARTDARAPLGIEEAISRANRYASIGADVIFVEAPQSTQEIEQIAAAVDTPLLLNIVPGGRTPEVPHARLAELGYRIAIHPGVPLAAVVPAAVEALSRLREQAPSLDGGGAGPESFFDLFGLSAWNELGRRYDNPKQ